MKTGRRAKLALFIFVLPLVGVIWVVDRLLHIRKKAEETDDWDE